jgi:hypothetical protein
MNTPPNRPDAPLPMNAVDETKVRAWLRLREELAELHARLEYMKLLISLGVTKP